MPAAERAELVRLLVLRARARHFRRDLAAHDDTAAALRLVDAEREPLVAAQALNMHAISSGYLGDLHAQLRCLDRGLEALLRSEGPDAARLRSVMRHNLAVALYDLGDARGALGLLADARREVDLVGLPRQQEWVLMSSVAAASFLLRGYEGQAPVEGEEREELLGQVSEWTAQAVAAGDRAVELGEGMANRRGASWCQAREAQLRGDLDRRSATPGTRSAWSAASASSTSWPGRGRCSRRSSWTSTGSTRPRTSSSRRPRRPTGSARSPASWCGTCSPCAASAAATWSARWPRCAATSPR